MQGRPVPTGFEGSVMSAIEDFLCEDEGAPQEFVIRPHPLLFATVRDGVSVVVAPACVWDEAKELLEPFESRFAERTSALILVGRPRSYDVDLATSRGLVSVLPADATRGEMRLAKKRALELLLATAHAETRGKWLRRYRYELGELLEIARTMTTERDVTKLLSMILEKSRFITGADAGSIYVVESAQDGAQLRFKFTQNDSVQFDSREFVMPLSSKSIAGSAAVNRKPINIADVYDLPPNSPFAFDRRIDEKIGYRTKSILVIPLISRREEVIGVIQLINKKKEPRAKLLSPEDVNEQVIPFDERSEELLGMLAAHAGGSLETALLYAEIHNLFEGFVRASVQAIESRDPTTSGHSQRVAGLTIKLAKIVDSEKSGPYKDAFFSKEDLRELEYASLLHDFGKIGVREKVLVKAKKLQDERLHLVRSRFEFVIRSLEAEMLSRKVAILSRGSDAEALRALDRETESRRLEIEQMLETVLLANEPAVLSGGDFARIEAIAKETYVDLHGEVKRLLDAEDVIALTVKQGSLTPSEFDEIRSHVTHTFQFLSQIPWGSALRRVPLIAGAHHERLNGTGYPNRWKAEEIPLQSKLMSIADIFDALTASDRPYKPAVPVARAMDILEYNVRDGHLDGELVRMFRDARVWEC